MSDDLVKQAVAELQDVVRCRCHPAYTGRGLHDPDCECDSADAVKVVSDRIEELEAEAEAANAIIAQERSEVLALLAENQWLRAWQNAAFLVHSNIDLDIEADPEARAAMEDKSDE